MSGIVVVGAQWGDEGKGKIIDTLTAHASLVVRYQGGSNAGHTLVVEGRKLGLRLTPSGILQPHARCIIAAGVVVDPEVLIGEMQTLREGGVAVSPQRLLIDERASIVLPVHREIDSLREEKLGELRIGTTKRGIGPAYEDRAARSAIRFCDLVDQSGLADTVKRFVETKQHLLATLGADPSQISVAGVLEQLEGARTALVPFVADTSREISDAAARGERILFEGAQGVLLDQTFGTVPYVTSSSTIAGAVAIGAGIPLRAVRGVLGIAKAYVTRVGAGPFPTLIGGTIEEEIRQRGREFGTVTGRPRACGWLDLVGLRYAHRLNGFDALALMKLDVLSGLETIKVCTGYRIGTETISDTLPPTVQRYTSCEPIFEELAGWQAPIEQMRSFSELPKAARDYVRFIEENTGVPVAVIGVGPEREALVRHQVPEVLAPFFPGER